MQALVLVVDDEPDVVLLVRVTLEAHGYAVIEANDASSALRALARQQPDLILLDAMMPERDGWEVLSEIKADPANAPLPIIMLTALSSENDQLRAWKLGAADYITKPFSHDVLTTAVAEALVPKTGGERARRRREVVERLTRADSEREKRRREHILALRMRADAAVYQMAALVESSDSALVAVTREGLVTTWNQGARRIFQWTADEAMGRRLSLLVRPRNAGSLRTLFDRVEQGEVFRDASVPCMRRDGSRVDLAVSATPIIDVAGEVKGAWVSGRDLTTERWAASRFRGLFEGSPDATVIVRDGRIELVNSQAERRFGYAANDVVGRPIELLLPEWPLAVDGRHNGAPRTVQLKGRRRNGQQFPVEASVSLVEAEEGELVSAALRDTSAQMGVVRFAKAFDHAPIAMALVSSDGQWLVANQTMVGWLGPNTVRMIDVVHPGDWPAWEAAVSRLISGADDRVDLQQVWVVGGSERCVRVRASLTPDTESEPSRVILAVDED
jgi:PAS domain S-box-containing protein